MNVYNLQDLAQALNGQAVGDIALPVTGACEPQDAAGDLLAIATTQSYVDRLPLGQACIALLAEGTDWQSLNLLGAVLVPRPRFAMAGLSQAFDHRWRPGPSGVHPQACVEPGAQIGAGARIGAFCHIGAGVVLGDNAWLDSHVTLAEGCVIGPEATLMAGVRIGAGVHIGARFIAQPGAVIGADGFSFVTPERSAVENVRKTLGDNKSAKPQPFARIHSLGSVVVGNDVELGANTCIDRGTIRDTQIGDGCKFDNLAQIGHNVKIGNHCIICAQVGIAGSSVLGKNVVLGGQTGVSDNLFIGDNAITGGATKVLSNIPAGRVMLGYPAMKMDTQLEVYKNLRRLPRVLKDLSRLKKSLLDPDNGP